MRAHSVFRSLAGALLLLVPAAPTLAADLGVRGMSWAIAEPDGRPPDGTRRPRT